MNPPPHPEYDPAPQSLRPGEVLGGRFEILRRLGAGGMGEVYEASDRELGVAVALKTIRYDRAGAAADSLERSRAEVNIARQVTHPNVCRIFDVGRDGDRIYFTMELVHGDTLAGLLRRGPLSAETALPLVRQMAEGLDALHGQGIVHRDFKPSNVLIAETSAHQLRAVLTDFGLARVEEETMTLGSAGEAHLAGTPDYMAPEQLLGKAVTSAADIYALGLVLYEMVAGVRAYPGGRALENAVQRLAELPPPPSTHAPDLPRAWDAAILQCLARDPAARPASARSVVAALSDEAPVARARRTNRWLIPVAAAVVLAGVVAIAPWTRRPALAPAAGGAHESYLKAQDALDHYYRPHGVEDAVRLFEQTLTQDNSFALAYAGLAKANFLQYFQLRDAKFVEPARANAEKALSLDPQLASVHVTLGRLYTETGKNDLAAQELNEALRIDPRNAEAYYALAALYDKQGRTADVLPNYQKAMDLAPGDWRFPDNLADFYLRSGDRDKALEYELQAVRVSPDNARALSNLGRVYRRMGRLDEARISYENALRIEASANRYTNLGVILDDSGHPEEAIAAYRKAIELNPSYYLVWGNLGYALAEMPGRQDEEKQAFEEGVRRGEALREARPNDTDLLSSLGQYYAVLGRADKSLPLVRQAAALAPSDPQLMLSAAVSNELLHRRADALDWIARALSKGLPLATIERSWSLTALRRDPQFLKLATEYAKKPKAGE